MAWTTTNLLSQVKVRAGWPSSGGYLTDAEILSLADDEMLVTVAPLLRAAREEYWVVQGPDVALSSSVTSVRIPPRALGSALRDVLIVQGTSIWSAPEISPEDSWRYQSSGNPAWKSPCAFFCEGSYVRFVPSANAAGYSARLKYYRRPSQMVPLDEAVVVTTATAPAIGFSGTAPTGWVAGDYDAIDALSPYDATADSFAVTVVADGALTVASIPDGLEVGNYVALEGTSPVPQIPVALAPILVLATVRACLESSGDTQSAAAAAQQLQRKSEAIRALIEPRVTGERLVVINRSSALRGSRNGGW